jgi:hypothetical protein
VADIDRLEALLEKATVDCYSEEEAFWGIFYSLDEGLNFPLPASALGDAVQVLGLDDERSGLRRGVVARVRKAGREYPAAMEMLEFVDLDPASAEWLEVYQYWAEGA